MPQALSILANDSTFDGLDFQELRTRGLEHIARFSGDLWTDHNLHDPGITILEVLCYALADLGYRTRLPIADLLAKNIGANQQEDNFFTPAEILTNNPLTIEDYRKLLLDIAGVRNAWLEVAEKSEVEVFVNCERSRLQFEKVHLSGEDLKERLLELNGLYNVYVELEPALTLPAEGCNPEADPFASTLAEVRQKLHDHRNLCEDFLNIIVLRPEEIAVCGDVELEPDAVPETVLTKIYEAVQNFLSPSIHFHTLEEMVKKGKSIEEIFEGRPLTIRSNHTCDCKTGKSSPSPPTYDSHGFIDPEELRKMKRHTEIHASDIYRVVMQVKGVRAIKKLFLVNYLDGAPQTLGEQWCLRLTPLRHPVLSAQLSNLNFFKGVLPFRVEKRQAVEALGKQLRNFHKIKLPANQLDRVLPQGKFRPELSEHRSIIHEFPLNYSIGQDELPRNATPLRQAQVHQLRGYLLFYDQLLANYLGQVGRLRDLFSMRPDSERTEAERRSVFEQALADVPDAPELLRYFTSPPANGVGSSSGGGATSVGSPTVLSGGVSSPLEAVVGNSNLPNLLLPTVPNGNGCTAANQTIGLNQVLATGWHIRQNEEGGTEATDIFANPETRDIAREKTRRAFENGQTFMRIEPEMDGNTERFRFFIYEEIIENQPGIPLLRSRDTYATREQAQFVMDELELLGATEQAYLTQDNAKKGAYTFSLAFNPLTYAQSLRQLAENEAAYLLRRDAMLSHLLARFGEHFTDYVLLMFALNKQRSDQKQINEDKANFLTHYPQISRNRGKASNYADPEQVWNTPNITGLERRVTALMGIHDWKRQTIGNFEVVRRTDRYRLVLKDQSGYVIFTSEDAFPTLDLWNDEWEKFTNGDAENEWLSFPQAAAEPSRYRSFDCAGASAYGFELIGKNGCRIARHPVIYPTAQERDAAKDCIQKWAKANGCMAEIKASGEGFYFKLFPDPTDPLTADFPPNAPLFESPRSFESEDEAWQAFLDFIEAAQKDENYHPLQDPVSGRHSFFVGLLPSNTSSVGAASAEPGSEQVILAVHPLTYPEAELANKMRDARLFVQKKYAPPVLEGGEDWFGWELVDNEGNLLLHSYLERLDPDTGHPTGSRYVFKNRLHAAAALVEAMEVLAPIDGLGTGRLLKSQNQAGTEFYLRLEKTTGLATGHAQFDSESGRDLAAKALLAVAGHFFEQNPLLEKPSDGFVFYLYNTTQPLEVLLKSAFIFRTAEAAVEAGEKAADSIAANGILQLIAGEKDCEYFVEMTDACGERSALSPPFDNREQAVQALGQIKTVAATGKLAAASHRQNEPAFGATLQANVPGEASFSETLPPGFSDPAINNPPTTLQNTVLRSHRLFATRQEALLAWLRLSGEAKDPANFVAMPTGECHFRPLLKDPCGGWLATSDETFGSKEALEQWLSLLACELQETQAPLGFPATASPVRFHVQNEQKQLLMSGEQWHLSVFEAKRAYFRFICIAGKLENYHPLEDANGCRFGFKIVEGGTILATHPCFYLTEGQNLQKQAEIAAWMGEHCYNLQVKNFDGKWYLQLRWRSCDGCCRTLLEGPLRNDFETAQQELVDLLALIKNKNCIESTAPAEKSVQKGKGAARAATGDPSPNTTTPTAQKVPCFVLKPYPDEENGQPSFYIADRKSAEVRLAWFPGGFASDCRRDSVMAEAMRYLAASTCTIEPHVVSSVVCEKPIVPSPPGQDPKNESAGNSPKQVGLRAEPVYGFRLRREEEILAAHPGCYEDCEKRDLALKSLWKKLKKGTACFFTNVETRGKLVVKCKLVRPGRGICEPAATELFYYLILNEKNGRVLWRSWEGFESEEAAQAAFESEHVAVLTLSRLKINYRQTTSPDGKPAVQLLNQKSEPVAEIPPAVFENTAPDMAIRRRIEFALAFPVVRQDDETFSFQLYDLAEDLVLWKSKTSYPSAAAAWEAFCRFQELLTYRGNWLPAGSSQQGCHSFELGNVLLESRRLYKNEDDAWDALKDFLLAVQQEGGIRSYRNYAGSYNFDPGCGCDSPDSMPFVAHAACGFGFEAGGDGFLLAKHPNRRFRTYEERELTLSWLFRSARCREKMYSKTGVTVCQIKGIFHFCITDDGFGLRTPAQNGTGDFSPNDFLQGVKTGQASPANSNCLWLSHEGYATAAEAEKAYHARRFEILEMAKEPGFYSVVQHWDGSKLVCQIQLSNLAGQVVAVVPKNTPLTNSNERLAAIYYLIYHARLYPFVKNRDGSFSFQLYDPAFDPAELSQAAHNLLDGETLPACSEPGFWSGCLPPSPKPLEENAPGDCSCEEQAWHLKYIKQALQGGVVWESATTYPNLTLAVCDFERFLKVLPDADAYRRTEKDECGPYAIELTDPSKSIAWHPLTLQTRTALENAVLSARSAIDVEGFHVLEHILLRPFQATPVEYVVKVGLPQLSKPSENEIVLLMERTFPTPLDACRYLNGLWENMVACLDTGKKDEVLASVKLQVERLLWMDSTWVVTKIEDKTNPGEITNLERWLKYAPTLENGNMESPCGQLGADIPKWLSHLVIEKKQEVPAVCDLLPICTEDCEIPTRQDVEAQPGGTCDTPEAKAEDAWYESYLAGADPYSFWATVVIPFWSRRFIDVNFRNFFEETIRREAPAWVGLRILWVHPRQMRRFEQAYRRWLEARTHNGGCDLLQSQRTVIQILKDMKNEYLPARLFDCGAGAQGNVVFLNQTKLG